MAKFRLLIPAIALILFGAGIHAASATDESDLVVGMKVLPLLTDKISAARVAIVYDPGNPSSKADAEGIKKIFDKGFQAPAGIKLSPELVPVTDLGRLANAKIAILTNHLFASFDVIAKAAAAGGVLTLSTDLDCVKSGVCVLGIVSKPDVQIYYSKSAADAARIGFSQAFTMLAKQV